ncbi:MAG: DotU family type IV/VI secretion system protein [Gemmatimonadaceae bacterium]
MTSQTSAPPTAASVTAIGGGRLALLFQESLTAITRLRIDQKAVADAATFRAQILRLLHLAEEQGKAMGYDPADMQLAVFAVVALLDESALNSREATWADWARRPVQDELFGGHMAGEWFFQHIERLLARPDTPHLADLLELHQLCLLLGFRGRYGASDRGALHAISAQISERLRRIRGAPSEFVPGWLPPNDVVASRDPWIRPLVIGLVSTIVLAGALWGAGALALRSAVGEVAVPTPAASPAASQ